jgi:cytochrome b subunit of formate dehydrogenase
MSKARFLFTLSALAFVSFLLQVISGFILWKILPRGGGDGIGRGFGGDAIESTFGWGRHTWLDIHDWTGVALLVIIIVHIYMHRKWLYNQLRSLFNRK